MKDKPASILTELAFCVEADTIHLSPAALEALANLLGAIARQACRMNRGEVVLTSVQTGAMITSHSS